MPKTPSTLAPGIEADLLAAPDGGRGEVLVEAFLEHDVGGGQVFASAAGLLVQPAERRTAIAGDESRRVQARLVIQPMLVDQDSKQRLDAGDENPTLREQKLVVERHFRVPHRNFLPSAPRPSLRRSYKIAAIACQKRAPANPIRGKNDACKRH
jgi:hypothetical protein